MLNRQAIAMLNHLLAQSGWALPRLARLGGRTVRFKLTPFVLSCAIQPDGSLSEALPDASADATFHISPALLPRLALADETALDSVVRSGDASLIEEIFFLARNLRWDASEDLSHVTGDIAAERIVGAAHDLHQQAHQGVLNLAQALTEYLTEERPVVASSHQLVRFASDVSRLDSAIMSLEQRLQALMKVS